MVYCTELRKIIYILFVSTKRTLTGQIDKDSRHYKKEQRKLDSSLQLYVVSEGYKKEGEETH